MDSLVKFNRPYAWATLAIFCVELLIAKFLHDRIVRPYIGDLLVVILIYCFVRALFNTPVLKTAIGVLAFAFLIEALQYFKGIHRLGWQDSRIARMILGSTFEWTDLLLYVSGIAIVLGVEMFFQRRKPG